ncbi:hypothetical protein I2W78_17915 [Streptomyces spinoverrucosus]|uniref:DUF6236 family protein n=1 Tax=Streptomyces spinoverrucosus TaxID=284043 RepID=UPI0018C3E629|nr:DUF6236 family protein [Streptomyces spinoverrucosus]MBG0853673.1 hypothetical protein [Streptomyces spinoverrucosus]
MRDDTWLKYAALYWPKMGRLCPPDYPLLDSVVSTRLHEERWLVDIEPPKWAWAEVGQPFLTLINDHAQALRDRFGVHRIDTWGIPADEAGFGYAGDLRSTGRTDDPAARDAVTWLNPRFGFVHASKIGPEVVAASVEAGLAITGPGRGGTWVGMHPELASVYTCALTERVALDNQLQPVTDQELSHTALSGWTLDRLVRLLVDPPAPHDDRSQPGPDLVDAFVFLAFATVVPANLDAVPVEKIIEVRSKFGAELDAFRTYVTEQVQSFAALEHVRDLAVFQEYLHSEVQRTVSAQLGELRERLRSVGLESVWALANVKSVALPPLAALAAQTAGVPAAFTVPAAVAACVVSAPVQWRRQRRAALEESPVSYLFQLEQEISPPTLIDRLRRVWPA